MITRLLVKERLFFALIRNLYAYLGFFYIICESSSFCPVMENNLTDTFCKEVEICRLEGGKGILREGHHL